MRSMVMPSRNHHTESLERLKKTVGRSERDAVIRADRVRQAALLKQALKGPKSQLFTVGFHGFAQQQIARSVIGDGERITVAPVAEQELSLVVSPPQLVRAGAL